MNNCPPQTQILSYAWCVNQLRHPCLSLYDSEDKPMIADMPHEPSTALLAQPMAEITPLPRNHAGKLLTPPISWFATGLILLPIPFGIVAAVSGIGLAVHFSGNSAARAIRCLEKARRLVPT